MIIRHDSSSDDASAGVKLVLICESYGEGDKGCKWEGGRAIVAVKPQHPEQRRAIPTTNRSTNTLTQAWSQLHHLGMRQRDSQRPAGGFSATILPIVLHNTRRNLGGIFNGNKPVRLAQRETTG